MLPRENDSPRSNFASSRTSCQPAFPDGLLEADNWHAHEVADRLNELQRLHFKINTRSITANRAVPTGLSARGGEIRLPAHRGKTT